MSRIAIIAPSPIKGSGGVARIYNFAQALSLNGHECHIYIFNSLEQSAESLTASANAFYSTSGFVCHTDIGDLRGSFDLVIATRWDTAAIATKIQADERAYLIQDYEAYFNPVGDATILAENSYLLEMHAITYGRWLAWKLEDDFGKIPYHLDFSSDTKSFQCNRQMSSRLADEPSIAFVYQDDKPRRCPILGIEALGIVKHYRPDVKLYFVGSNRKPKLWYNFQNLGNLTTKKLNDLYNHCHVGLSLSSSNPSCNAFDMMAAGLPSVDIYRENNLLDIPDHSVLLAHQTQESIAEAILHLLDNTPELIQRSRLGKDFMASRSQASEVESFVAIVNSILAKVPQINVREHIPSSAYKKPPVIAEVNRTSSVNAYIQAQYRRITSLQQERERDLLHHYPSQVSYKRINATNTNQNEYYYGIKNHKYEKLMKRIRAKFGHQYLTIPDLFDFDYYLATNVDVAASGMDPFLHFVFHGAAEGRSPSPFFDQEWYAKEYSGIIPPNVTPIEHYIAYGSQKNLLPSAYFDPIWYSNRYPETQNSGMAPVHHYILVGEAEGHDPSERFASDWYLQANPDVAAEGMSPLKHYLLYGCKEGRSAIPRAKPRQQQSWEVLSLWSDLKDITSFTPRLSLEDKEPLAKRTKQIILDPSHQGRVSFDVWSTILHRNCHPDEIKLRSARFLLLVAWDEIRPAFREPVRLMEARMHAENASAPHGDFEYRFEDAISLWFENVLSASCGAEKRRAFAESLIEHELQAELDVVELDDNAASAIRNLKIAPIFVSDFYMRSSFIKSLLDSNGIGGYFARGYASCDTYENKRSGSLFKRVLTELEINPSELTHVGDNPIADDARPRSMGIVTVPYISQEDEHRYNWYTKAFENLRRGNPGLHQRRILALCEGVQDSYSRHDSSQDRELYQTGCTIGILAFSFCLNLMQDAIERRVKEVVFFAREGILFKQIYDEIARCNPFSIAAPPSKILHVSRRATFAASLESFNNDELMRLWTMYWKQSPASFAKSLNFDPSQVLTAANKAGVDMDLTVEAPWKDKKFQTILNDPKFRSYALESIADQRNLLTRYIAQELSIDNGEMLICDIGWRGTIQDNIAKIIDCPITGHYLALLKFLNDQPDSNAKIAWLSDENNERRYTLPNQPAPFEMIFNGLGGSTIGYRQLPSGDIEPIREIHDAEESVVEALEPCRLGMMAIIDPVAHYVRLHGLVAADLHSLSCKIADEFIQQPPRAVADLFGRLEHNETFGVGLVEAMEKVAFRDVVSAAPGADLHHGLSDWLGTRWPQGMSRQGIVQNWFAAASPVMRRSTPIEIAKIQSPAIIREVGSRLSLYFPEPIRRSGGQRTAINMIKALVKSGFNANIYVENMKSNGEILEEYLGDTAAEIFSGWSTQRPTTVAIATVAHSAQYLTDASLASFNCYLVQDYEALFHPLGSAYLEAERSYTSGLHHLTIGNWLSHLLKNKYGIPAQPAGFGVDTQTYKLVADIVREKAICLLYQPEKPWRANELALRVLSLVKKRKPDAKVYIFGSDQVPETDFEFENLGVIDKTTDLNDLYNRCRAGICFGLSNPSRIPFEMTSAGCGVVDLYRYNNLMDHQDENSVLAYQGVDSIADAVCALLADEDPDGTNARLLSSTVAHRSIAWENDSLVANVMNVIGNNVPLVEELLPSYTKPAFISRSDSNPTAHDFCRLQFRLARQSITAEGA